MNKIFFLFICQNKKWKGGKKEGKFQNMPRVNQRRKPSPSSISHSNELSTSVFPTINTSPPLLNIPTMRSHPYSETVAEDCPFPELLPVIVSSTDAKNARMTSAAPVIRRGAQLVRHGSRGEEVLTLPCRCLSEPVSRSNEMMRPYLYEIAKFDAHTVRRRYENQKPQEDKEGHQQRDVVLEPVHQHRNEQRKSTLLQATASYTAGLPSYYHARGEDTIHGALQSKIQRLRTDPLERRQFFSDTAEVKEGISQLITQNNSLVKNAIIAFKEHRMESKIDRIQAAAEVLQERHMMCLWRKNIQYKQRILQKQEIVERTRITGFVYDAGSQQVQDEDDEVSAWCKHDRLQQLSTKWTPLILLVTSASTLHGLMKAAYRRKFDSEKSINTMVLRMRATARILALWKRHKARVQENKLVSAANLVRRYLTRMPELHFRFRMAMHRLKQRTIQWQRSVRAKLQARRLMYKVSLANVEEAVRQELMKADNAVASLNKERRTVSAQLLASVKARRPYFEDLLRGIARATAVTIQRRDSLRGLSPEWKRSIVLEVLDRRKRAARVLYGEYGAKMSQRYVAAVNPAKFLRLDRSMGSSVLSSDDRDVLRAVMNKRVRRPSICICLTVSDAARLLEEVSASMTVEAPK